ncbi:MAG TPA: GxxExxY protein [Flavobacteriales bacterium]|nr:GxxExxY protein [Flavobacteriales bacterium]
MTENEISYILRGAIFRVYNNLGPGLLESVYVAALKHELHKNGLKTKTQVPVPVIYDNIKLELGFRLDVIVNDMVILEIKSVESLLPVHKKQLLTYLRLTNKKLGLLVNFNTEDMARGITRIVNNL